MENKKSLIISSIIIVVVILFVIFYPKGKLDKDFVQKSNFDLSTLDFDYKSPFVTSYSQGEEIVNSELYDKYVANDWIKPINIGIMYPWWYTVPQNNVEQTIYISNTEWKDRCVVFQNNWFLNFSDEEYCQQERVFEARISDSLNLHLKIIPPFDLNNIPSKYTFSMELNGKYIDLPAPEDIEPSEVVIHPLDTVLVNYYYLWGPDGSLPTPYYYNGEKWFSVDDIVELCVPEDYKKLGFGQDLGGFGFEAHLSKNFLHINEQTYFLEPAYYDIFNTARVYYLVGGFTFNCDLKNLEFISAQTYNKGLYISDKNGIPSKTISNEYKQDFISFMDWVSKSSTEELKEVYKSFPANSRGVFFNGKVVRIPLGWDIQENIIEGSSGMEKYFLISKGGSTVAGFSENVNNEKLLFNAWSSEYFDDSNDFKILSIEDFRNLYILKVGLEDTIKE